MQLRVDLPILVLEAVDLNLSVHILFVKVFARLERHLGDLILQLALDFLR